MGRRVLIAGNWKMNRISESVSAINEIAKPTTSLPKHVEVVVFPPATLLAQGRLSLRGHGVEDRRAGLQYRS